MGFVASDLTEYTDFIPEMGEVYNYCIEAVNDCGESNWSCDEGFIDEPGGDINSDGNIDVLDVIVVVNIILGSYQPDYLELSLSDLNNDSVVDILDIIIITNNLININNYKLNFREKNT